MLLHFIRTPKPRNPVLEELYAQLCRRQFEVSEGIPEREPVDLDAGPRHDLYVLKGRTKLALSYAGILELQGARVLNPYAACATILDKLVATARLRRAGIPVPRSWAAADKASLAEIAAGAGFPLIVKPFDGIGSRGITVIRDMDGLAAVRLTDEPVLVQEYVDGCTRRYKIHCVGERVFATWKPFSLGGVHDHSQPCDVGDEVRDLARRCGRLFGLGLYGLDVLFGPGGPVVVDLNSFPGYGDLPGIGTVLADYIEAYARGQIVLPAAGARFEPSLQCG